MDLLAAIEERFRQVVREEIATALASHNGKPAGLLDTKQAADFLRLPASWVATATRQGKLKSVKCGHHVRFKMSDLEAFVDEQRKGVEVPALQRRTKESSNSERPSRRLAGSNDVQPVQRDELSQQKS